MKNFFTLFKMSKKLSIVLAIVLFFVMPTMHAMAQLGTYAFTGTGSCPNQNAAVTLQPAGATFSTFTSVGTTCVIQNDVYSTKNLNNTSNVNTNEYFTFSITSDANTVIDLTSISFVQQAENFQNNNTWYVRSSVDNYASDVASGSITQTAQTATVSLPAANFSNLANVTFRIYVTNHSNGKSWILDDVTINGTTKAVPSAPSNNISSNSPQCEGTGVTITSNDAPPAGVHWFWQTSPTGTSTLNGNSSYLATSSGTYYLRAQDDVTLLWSNGAPSITVVVNQNILAPVFSLGATSTRCQAAGSVNYVATVANSTSLVYSLDAASIAGGNSINTVTGAVTYVAGWAGTTTITATATGICNGPTASSHTVTITSNVAAPIFALGATSLRCQGAGTITYNATAANSTSISYAMDIASLLFGNTINTTTGAVTFTAGWSGNTTIQATAIGCNGSINATHVVTVTASVATPVFSNGSSSSICKGSTFTYTATAANASSIGYSLDAASIAAGNTINTANGTVVFSPSWAGPSVITATALGCIGPKTSTHNVTITNSIPVPVFSLGATSSRCPGSGNVTYTATASGATSISYSLDATSLAAGNTISSTTGAVNYNASWSGTTIITATATGCNGPTSATHTVSHLPLVEVPILITSLASPSRCQGTGTIDFGSTALNSTSISYSLNGLNTSGGNSVNTSGVVTFSPTWVGSTPVTVTAQGCSGPKISIFTVTTIATVGTPVFGSGATSTRCQGANTITYAATAANSTSISYSLDATSLAGGNTINPTTGAVTYSASWFGSTVITATALGCNGPKTAIHTVTVNPSVALPVFASGATSNRCQGLTLVTYTATAANATSISYSIDATSLAGGVTVNATTGVVRFSATWVGNTTVTATAIGCNGPAIATHIVTTTPTVSTPIFTLGATSTRCQGNGSQIYVATAANSTSISYALDNASLTAGNTINSATGSVNFVATWSGTSTVTANAIGCNGPTSANHTITITPSVGNPIFTLGAESVRNQGANTVTYTGTATTNTGITYSLDASSLLAGNTINATTGAVTWVAGWFGTSAITANATGCNSSSNASHFVITNPAIVQTPLYLSIPGQILDRNDPVSQNIVPIAVSNTIGASAPAVSLISSVTTTGVSNSITVNYTTTNAPFRAMLVGVSHKNRTVTSVTYGGVPLTLLGENNVSGLARVAIYGMLNPPEGLAQVSVNFNLAPDRGAVVNVSTFSGVNQTTPYGSFVTSNALSTNPRVNITAAAGEVLYNVLSKTGAAPTAGAGQNVMWSQATGLDIYGAGGTKVGAATFTDWTGGLDTWAMGAINLKPATNQNSISFTQSPILCNNLVIKAQPIQVVTYVRVQAGTMPINPTITAALKYGTNTIINLTNPVYNTASGILTWSGTLASDVTVPDGQAIQLDITSTQPNVDFQIQYHSVTKPSRISLLPVSTFIDILSFDIFSAPYPGGIKRLSGKTNTTYYVRAKVTTPFGYKDITGLDLTFAPLGASIPVTCVDSSTCTRTYEYPWTTSNVTGVYNLLATAKEGSENLIKNSDILSFDVCNFCPPIALNDSASGSAGAPIIVNVLANDNDPNDNIKVNTLAISTQPRNGSGFIQNNQIIYLPNGTFFGRDTLQYRICDSTGLCGTAYAFFDVSQLIIDPCAEATKTHTYFIPYPEQDAFIALQASSSTAMPSNNIRTVISLTVPYPGMTVVWDEWEDGYEVNPLNPSQATTKVWGDGNPYNGIAPGYSTDVIPAGGSIVLDNTMGANPRVPANIFYDGKDMVTTSGQVAITQVCGEPTNMPVQDIKTNVTSTFDFGQSFTVPLGTNFPSRDFQYTALFVRAQEDGTVVDIDKDNNGTLETNFTLNKGESYLVNGGVNYGATVTSNKPVGVELNAGGVDTWSIRNASIFPATWYSNTYYTPVPTSDNAADNPKDSSVVMFYNSLSRPITINWVSGVPASGSIVLPAKGVVRFPLVYSATATYKFFNPTGESFTAIEIIDSHTPGGGGNDGTTYDWSFNLISEARLTDFATTAWAPGGLDLVAPAGPDVNGNPVWVTPTVNTTIYVKWDGNVSGNTGLVSPCGLRYDVSYTLNALNYIKLRDLADNDQSGLAVYTCNGAKLAAVYGEDPQGSNTGVGVAYWDVGTTILPFCKQKLIFANDDYGRTVVNQPVTLPILINDFGYLAVVDPTTVSLNGLLQPKHGTVTVNSNGTLIYTPNTGYVGKDTFEYRVCSTPAVVCDDATVYIDIASCPAPYFQNVIGGQVFIDKNNDGISNDGNTGIAGPKVYLYVDGNCNGIATANELSDSVTVDASGMYQFVTYPEKYVEDNFDGVGGARTCADGSDGNAAWLSNWVDAGDLSVGYCNNSQTAANTDVEILKDGAFTNALRLKGPNVSATRTVNLAGAAYAFLSFSYHRKSTSLAAGENLIVQASTNGIAFSTIFTIVGDGTTDANYIDISNQDITAYAAPITSIRFLTNSLVDDADTVYIDNVKIQYLSYPQCYITKLDVASVPQYYHTTSPLQHNVTATSMQTCLSPYSFGLAKDKLTISGTIYLDANGLTDNLVNGTPIGTLQGNPLYAYLIDSTGKVVNRANVNTTTGAYSFTNADVVTNYNLMISSSSVNVDDMPPSIYDISAVPGNWITTGDAFGINNAAGTGIKPGLANCTITVRTNTSNVTNVNFGVERAPDSDNKNISYLINIPNTQYPITGGLSGSDPEDGVLGSSKTYKITALPYAAILFYSGTAVVLNQVITNFNPALLSIDPDDDILSTSFKYVSRDNAGVYDPTPATITVTWGTILPVSMLSFDGRLNGTQVDLFWKTTNELNSSYFDVERSTNGTTFTKITKVDATGLPNTVTNYTAIDPSPENGYNYYRLKVVDKDGKFNYSSIVKVRVDVSANFTTSVKPNPFVDKFDVYVTLQNADNANLQIFDVSGKKVYEKIAPLVSGTNKITLTNLAFLQSGTYVLKIITQGNVATEKIIKQ